MLLNARKLQAGHHGELLVTFDLPVLLKDLEMMFRVRTDEKKLSFSVEMIGAVPRYIVTDINKLRQVFISVLGNAVKFTEQGGIGLRVRADRAAATGPFLQVEIEDTGPGIRSMTGGADPKIIAVTASAMDENRQELMQIDRRRRFYQQALQGS
jgi:signal transduction histidine kinase